MAIKFQYNKTELQRLQQQLKIRQNALPTLKSKESALRLEVKKARAAAAEAASGIAKKRKDNEILDRLWVEFPDIITLGDVDLTIRKIAGVKIPILNDLEFNIAEFSLFNAPAWVLSGVEVVREMTRLSIVHKLALKSVKILEYARKKTTQKVNLYEKVQIPGFEEAIRKIKRFMEDVDNLSKAAQKIVKSKMDQQEAAA